MGQSTDIEPIEMIAYEGMVILKGFGSREILLSAEAAERLAYRLSGIAFMALNQKTAVAIQPIPRSEWRFADQGSGDAGEATPPRRKPPIEIEGCQERRRGRPWRRAV